MVTRRSALRAGLATAGLGVAGAAFAHKSPATAQAGTVDPHAGHAGHGVPAPSTKSAAATVEKYRVALPISPVLSPQYSFGATDVYSIGMRRVTKEIVPGKPTEVLTYNGLFPGPTIRARTGRAVAIRQHNGLDVPTSVHLHGASVHTSSDGLPMDVIEPGDSRVYYYPNQQPHAPLWYHDHAHHVESENVYRGLSGSYLLTDDVEESLPLPSGEYETVLAIRDAHLDTAGNLVYATGDRNRHTLLVNGAPYPYFEVAARKYRLRLLNSCNMRSLELRLADGGEMVQIGSDGGLLTRPHATDSVFLSAAERADVIIDFSRYPVGTQLVLENTAGGGPTEQVGQVMRFDVVRTAEDRSEIPSVLRELPRLPEPTARRSVELFMTEDGSSPFGAYIDGKTYDPDRVDAHVRHGASEIWTVTNGNTLFPHNFHMHLVQFRVLERDGQSPGPAESGLKDTVFLPAGSTVTLQATFDTYQGDYVYHCHMLDHSALGMMATMRIA